MYIAKTMNSTTSTISPLMAGAAKLAKELAARKAGANAGAAMPVSGAAADTLDVSIKILWWLEYMYFLKILVPGEAKIFFLVFKLIFNLKGLVMENSWLGTQLQEAQRALAECQGAAYPLELLWSLLALVSLGMLVDAGRVLWHRTYPADVFPWDM